MKDRPFEKLIEKAGYRSVAEFAACCEVFPQQVFRHVRGQVRPSIGQLVSYANNLDIPFMDLVEFFYPDEMDRLQKMLK